MPEYTPAVRNVWSLQEARDILRRLVGDSLDWISLETHLADYIAAPQDRATVLASSFASSLELVRQGELELRQTLAFGPLMMRRRRDDGGRSGGDA